ncbi:endonuclease [Arcticibacter svalbardensis MN12-7]|uniref:Endonuclease n=1 Tax=Arcticibacter svalbardensis MN12-7 TaxID=1150600 RepID=R9GX77_9SPHI|nr:S1/P1 nuclease [Arcticibacter svalbardensis]EOR96253.1 endonuclease [Arcticibacter svalbardensis MN12-7]
MKKYFAVAFMFIIAITLISWGAAGHKTIAKIAENHLTPKAKDAIKVLLGDENMTEVAPWADQLRNDTDYKNTAAWHYLNVPLGLSYEQFSKTVKEQGANNIYGALIKFEAELTSNTSTPEQKTDALKFIIHFVGDMHQPMHISRSEDKGGNSIQLQFDGKGTNLHKLWDSGLINKQGMNFTQMAITYDKTSPSEISQWQSDSPMKWMFESYLITASLYKDAEKNNKPDDRYYQENIKLVQKRIEMGGIRLAGTLNTLFKSFTPAFKKGIPINTETITVPSKDLALHYGQTILTVGKVYSGRFIQSNQMTLLNIGGDNPNQDLTVMIQSEDRVQFGQPEVTLKGKTIQIIGKVIDYRGKPEIIVTESAQIKIIK